MNKVILAIKIVSALWASIIALIKQAEELMPEQGQGAQKLAIVRAGSGFRHVQGTRGEVRGGLADHRRADRQRGLGL